VVVYNTKVRKNYLFWLNNIVIRETKFLPYLMHFTIVRVQKYCYRGCQRLFGQFHLQDYFARCDVKIKQFSLQITTYSFAFQKNDRSALSIRSKILRCISESLQSGRQAISSTNNIGFATPVLFYYLSRVILKPTRVVMALRLSLLLVVLLSFGSVRAQDVSYFAHKKYFYLCAYKKECSYCESCTKDVFKVRIKNNTDKRIKNVYYQFYSPLHSRTITNDAVIQGDMIEGQAIANIFICVKGPLHWAISKIVYTDDTEVSFVVDEPMKNFIQEPDECSCNLTPEDRKGS
jgi:hypothetical protein